MDYVLRGGDEGAKRLKLLARAKWPTTRALFRRIGLRKGMRCLDVGCGNGDVTRELARLTGSAAGIDRDERILEIARQTHPGIEFHAVGLDQFNEQNAYDFIFARYVLTHMQQPQQVVERLKTALRSGGILAVEDIDFPGHFCHPPCPAFDRYCELYESVVLKGGGDPAIGPKLFNMLQDAGLNDVRVDVVLPVFTKGIGKQLARITLEHIRESLLDARLATAEELERLDRELAEYAADPRTLQSMARTFQVWGRR